MRTLPVQTEPSLPVGYETFVQLRSMIISGALKEGTRLVERKLAAELKVSRTPVREALKRLEAEGLVQSNRSGGLIVTTFSQADIEEIFTIREALEGCATGIAALRRTPEALDAMSEQMELLQSSAEAGDIEGFWRLNLEFHALIYEAAASPRLYRMLMDTREYLRRFTRLGFRRQSRMLEASAEHREILRLLAASDAANAEHAARTHTRHSLAAVLHMISEGR